MNDEKDLAEYVCVVCKKACRGGFDVWSKERKDGTMLIAVDTTPDRDFNVCDSCNDVVHFRCSKEPDTGYCDNCLRKYRDNEGRYPDSL